MAVKPPAVCVLLLALCCCRAVSAVEEIAKPTPNPTFDRDVVPILKAYCWRCHGGEARQAALDLRSLPLMLAGGKSGAVLVRGAAEESPLFQKLASGSMPPEGELKPTTQHVLAIRRWIDAGARTNYKGGPLTDEQSPPLTQQERDWWSFRKPVKPDVPEVSSRDRVRTPIDSFVLQKLEANGLGFSPDADRVTLIRRACLDLIGLPPTPAEVDDFLADVTPDAYDRLIDRLLASPHYGERQGRHWLDAAGYVDAIGSDNDATIIEERTGIWKYRDYVVRSFNSDKPYDRFLIEQLAGDELVDWRNAKSFTPQIREMLIATGFLRLAADVTYAPELNTADIRNQVLYDTIQILGNGLLGLTIQCARCHSHKFDPISHADYFRLRAIFTPAYDIRNWKHSKERLLHDVSAGEKRQIDADNADVDRRVAVLGRRIADLRRPFEQQLLDAKLAQIPEPIRADTAVAVRTPAAKRTVVQRYLAEKFSPLLKINAAEIDKVLDEIAARKIGDVRQQIAGLEVTRKSYGTIQALWDVGPASPAHLHMRGDYQTPGPQVAPRVIAVLDDPRRPFRLPEPGADALSSGYRTAFADWLTQPDHPLTARVIVNRVWQHCFGTGIVATPDNFGFNGALPTHPKLLDWLATEFVESGWSFKHLHRLILTSTVYRQTSHQPIEAAAATSQVDSLIQPETVDPENRLLWRMPLRRLESEIIRDAVLAVSSRIETRLGGPPIPLKPNPDGSVEIDTTKLNLPHDRYRRSLYLFARRNYQLTELSVFDQPVVAVNCSRRTPSAVVSQSLAMLNGRFLQEQARFFAARVRAVAGNDEDRRIERAFRLALVRRPSKKEVRLCRRLLHNQGGRYREQERLTAEQSADSALIDLCQMLLNTNEFLCIE